jgi:hypothetical protein
MYTRIQEGSAIEGRPTRVRLLRTREHGVEMKDPRSETAPKQEQVSTIDPQRLLRVASVVHEVLEEVRRIPPEGGVVAHLSRLHERILDQLRQSLSADLYQEMRDLTPAIDHGTLEELIIAHAEILGWLEGLFQGTQLALQLEAARAFREQMRRAELPAPERREPRASSYL